MSILMSLASVLQTIGCCAIVFRWNSVLQLCWRAPFTTHTAWLATSWQEWRVAREIN